MWFLLLFLMRGFFFSNHWLQPQSVTWFSQWVVIYEGYQGKKSDINAFIFLYCVASHVPDSPRILPLQENDLRAPSHSGISPSLRPGKVNVLAYVLLPSGSGPDLYLTCSVKDSNLYLFIWGTFGRLETINVLWVSCVCRELYCCGYSYWCH